MIENEIKAIYERFDTAKKMIFEKEDKKVFEESEACWICKEKIEFSELKVRDHCHFTGQFRGAAHSRCNLLFRKPKFTPVIFHNLFGYDSHLFVTKLRKDSGNVKAIPNNEEK